MADSKKRKKRKLAPDSEFKDSRHLVLKSDLKFQNPDLALETNKDVYGYLVIRPNSRFVNPSMATHEVIERHLVVLFGLLLYFKDLSYARVFWSTINRYWFRINISRTTHDHYTEKFVDAVMRARGHDDFLYTSSVPLAKTHLGRLIDAWAQHRRDTRHIPMAKNPAPHVQDHKELQHLQEQLTKAINQKPLTVFAHDDKHPVTSAVLRTLRVKATSTRRPAVPRPVSLRRVSAPAALSTLVPDIDQIKATIRDLDDEISGVNDEISQLASKLSRLTSKHSRLMVRRDQLQATVRDLE